METDISKTSKEYTVTYHLKFYSEWHCGSGLGAGADVDALVVKDKNKLPYVPGKTIKGLIREAVENILYFESQTKKEEKEGSKENISLDNAGYHQQWIEQMKEDFIKVFGNSADKDWNIFADSDSKNIKENLQIKSQSFFSNAELEDSLKKLILSDTNSTEEAERYWHFLYNSVASISINEKGVAERQHLRRLETVVPCMLVGRILRVPESFIPVLQKGMQFIKRLGQNRNRGLGRCDMVFKSQTEEPASTLQEGGRYE